MDCGCCGMMVNIFDSNDGNGNGFGTYDDDDGAGTFCTTKFWERMARDARSDDGSLEVYDDNGTSTKSCGCGCGGSGGDDSRWRSTLLSGDNAKDRNCWMMF